MPTAAATQKRRRQAVATAIVLVIITVVLAVTWTINHHRDASATSSSSVSSSKTTTTKHRSGSTRTSNQASSDQAAADGQVPANALATLRLIDAGQWPPADAPGTNGGTVFRNNGHKLPTTDSQGKRISYREWDVNPKRPGHSRDAERIVTGSDGSAWYTGDHYSTFVKIRGPSS